MKNLIIICIVLLGFTGFAQKKQPSKMEARKEMRENMKSLSPQQKAELHAKKLTLQLDLSEKQEKEVTQLLAKKAEKRATMKESKAKKDLSETERFERKKQMLDDKIAYKKEMKQILSESQYTKWEESFGKQKKKHFKKRRKAKMRN
ncbi:hypothetical protein INR76_06810 [Marixanthomonas sp. SCSIO 43207]|uniref:hypothetical protein n=1 Tax=Marixanthomonas sp. SCSIO 43207 TaxID=2779360 RepID=UPI001CA99510|nr:hypothetical protein [Marixanthomonas sp. SCSIO 43207]UAB82462.1 hypothetical protein INR76_06810 [Marixanthomonas sp. SCSIO 43207]